MTLKIVIGNKRFSSWSLRPWLALRHTGAAFEEILLRMEAPDFKEKALSYSPTGKVPVLIDGSLHLWESLAICEYLAEKFPEAKLWPEDAAARATARAISSEMHSGFANLRRNMSMDVCVQKPGEGRAPGVQEDIDRITQLWRETRAAYGASGPFLFGTFTIADAMFAPVAGRFRTYAVELDPVSEQYVAALMNLTAVKEWIEAARLEL